MKLRRLFCLLLAFCIPMLTAGCGKDAPVVTDVVTPEVPPIATAVTIGDHKLTAVEFNYYYRDAVDDFYNDWANSYILGTEVADFDPSAPLNEQYYNAEADITWADHLIQEALKNAKQDYILSDLAKAEGFTLPAEYQAELESQQEIIATYANLYGYANIDSFLGAYYGPQCNETNYMAYIERQVISDAYANSHRESLTYSEDVLRSRDTGEYEACPMGNVRHLLVKFESGTTNEVTIEITYSDAEKEAARMKAEEYLDMWKNGAANEEYFIELVKAHSQDGHPENGGLYQNIHPGSNYVTAFRNWATDPARQPGETDIIETEYGYHVMYFVSWSDLNYRDYMITEQLRDADQEAWLQETLDAVEAEILDYSGLELDMVLDPGGQETE